MKRADLVLAAVLLLVAAALFIFGRISDSVSEKNVMTVTVDGIVYGRYPLDQDTVIDITTAYGRNELTIRSGEARMTSADCTGGDCMRMAPVTKEGGTILCLPHRLAVSMENGSSDIDVLVQ